MAEAERSFIKWAPLVALCRDGLRLLPEGWHEKYISIDSTGLTESLVYQVTNGIREAGTLFTAIWLDNEEALKAEVCGHFVNLRKIIDGGR